MGEDTPSRAAKPVEMRLFVLRRPSVAIALLAFALASCQGNLGSGTGLSIPQTGGFGQPGAPGQPGVAGAQSRQRALDGAVYLTSDASEIPLPTVAGYGVAIKLGTPGPSPSPSASGASPSANPSARARRTPSAATMPHFRAVAPSASPSPAPSQSPSPGASAAPSPASSGSPVASGKPSAAPSGNVSPKPSPSASSKPKIVTKTTIYPDDAPAAPTPEPSGDVQTFFKRVAIVRGFLQPTVDLSLYGLGAVRFTIPAEEQTSGRGFTIALFEAGKKHHEKMIASDTQSKLDDDAVASSRASGAIALKKGQGYYFILYGDEQPATPGPGPVPGNYSQPGTNPFVTPVPPGYPQQGQPGYPQGQPGAPYPTPTPIGVYPSSTPHY